MKKFTLLFAAMFACVLPIMSQSVDEPEVEQKDSVAVIADEPVAEDDDFADGIIVKYVPNRFADNWELNIAGGVSMLINGFGHVEGTTSAPTSNSGRQFYDATGGVAEITATKWFNPYAALRLGWTTGYLPFKVSQEDWAKSQFPLGAWDNYVHVDAMWDWTTQFGGYKPNRIYDAVPYVHVGVVANPAFNAAVGGGLGYLSRFHIAEHWLINLDLRGTLTSARKYGMESGISLSLNALIGVTYRFDRVGWKKVVENPYKETLMALSEANKDLADKQKEAEKQVADLQEAVKKCEQEHKDIVNLVNAITNDTSFYGVPDTLELTLYYAINTYELTPYELAHMNTYLRLIGLNDPNYMHMYKVIGTADAETGTHELNEHLCRQRANTIREELIKNGVDPENITTEIEIVKEGDAQLSRASRVIIYPVEKPKLVIPKSLNYFDEE